MLRQPEYSFRLQHCRRVYPLAYRVAVVVRAGNACYRSVNEKYDMVARISLFLNLLPRHEMMETEFHGRYHLTEIIAVHTEKQREIQNLVVYLAVGHSSVILKFCLSLI
jgi:hypothetical protein